jgi:hypothetical protein
VTAICVSGTEREPASEEMVVVASHGGTLRVGGATADAAAQLTCMRWPSAMVGTTLDDLKRMRVA